MTVAVELRNVTRSFPLPGSGQVHAVRDVSLTVPSGATTAIVGRSGSGKSTLLHLCAGIEVATTGEVCLYGTSLDKMTDADRTRLRRDSIGLVFQFFHLLPHLSVHDNIALPLLIAGIQSTEIKQRVESVLDMVGLASRAAESPSVLSGGEQQRIAICRAMVHTPRLILADEPTGNLDDVTGREIMDLLLGLTREQGVTLVVVTHSHELAELADRRCTMKSGRLIEE